METVQKSQQIGAPGGKQPGKLAVMKSPRCKIVVRLKTGKKRAGAAVSIPSLRRTISQDDFEELILLRRRSREAKEALDAKETYLLAALQSGAAIEPGVHTIALGQHLELDGGKAD
jgi:hypothetical protein